jgi:hypothetical protein
MWDIKDEPGLRPWFYSWSLLTRAFRPGMTLYNPTDPTDLRVLAGKTAVSGSNKWSIALVNRRSTDAVVNLAVPGEGAVTMSRFVYSAASQPKDANGFPVAEGQLSGNLGSGLQVTVPPNAMTVLTNLPQSTNIDDSMKGGGLNRWNFVGGWAVNNAAATNEYNRSTTFSDNPNDQARATFQGTGLRLYAHRGPGGGYAAVSVDGKPEQTVSFHNTAQDGNTQVWSTSGLSPGQHTVTVRVTSTHPAGSTGDYVSLDRLEALN